MILAYIPSPPQGVWHLGPVPIRAYALAIICGVIVAIWLGNRRWVARGGQPGTVADVAVWAVPFGLVGARFYHVVTDYQLYFAAGRDPLRALAIWEGGLGIWGGIAGGALGAWIACRRRGIPLPALADALAPGIVLAQAIGRLGNWFNQELFGGPTTQAWGLEIAAGKRPVGYEQYETFHPTFLYELIWNVGVAGLVIWADRRFKLGHGRAFLLYVAGYTAGRGWIEYMRIDPVNHILGLRLNVWTSILVFALAVAGIVISARMRPGREQLVEAARYADDAEAEADTAAGSGGAAAGSEHESAGTPRPAPTMEQPAVQPPAPAAEPSAEPPAEAPSGSDTETTIEQRVVPPEPPAEAPSGSDAETTIEQRAVPPEPPAEAPSGSDAETTTEQPVVPPDQPAPDAGEPERRPGDDTAR